MPGSVVVCINKEQVFLCVLRAILCALRVPVFFWSTKHTKSHKDHEVCTECLTFLTTEILKMKKLNLLIALMFFASSSFAQDDTTYKRVEYPEGFTAQLNVVYTKVKDWKGKMDIYLPPKNNKPSPLLINIHG